MIEWIKQNIFTTEGRINRLQYFKYTLLVSATIGIIQVIVIWLASKLIGSNDSMILSGLGTLISFPMFVGNAMVSVRRCHDLNLSGAYVLLCVIPVVNLLFGIYLLIAKGNVGWNKYGADPSMNGN